MIAQDVIERFQSRVKQASRRVPRVDDNAEQRVASAKRAFTRGLDGEMAVDLECCLHCGMCAEACHFYESTQDPKYTPIHKVAPLRRYYRRELGPMRWLYRMFTRDLTLVELEEWQELVFDSCTECGRCDLICPMGIRISAMVGVMRHGLTEAGLMPDELAGTGREQREEGTVLGVSPAELDVVIQALSEEGTTIPINKESADVMVLTTALELTSLNSTLKAMAKVLNAAGVDWTLCRAAFEASGFAYFSGDGSAERKAVEQIVQEARTCGVNTLVVPECGHAYKGLRWAAAEIHGERLPFEIVAISEFIGRAVQSGRLSLTKTSRARTVTYHDPCKIGRLGGVLDEPRAALEAMGLDVQEMESHGTTQYCCGGGAGVILIERAERLRQRAFEIKMRQVDDTGASAVVTTCETCRMSFTMGATRANWQIPVESLVELAAEHIAE